MTPTGVRAHATRLFLLALMAFTAMQVLLQRELRQRPYGFGSCGGPPEPRLLHVKVVVVGGGAVIGEGLATTEGRSTHCKEGMTDNCTVFAYSYSSVALTAVENKDWKFQFWDDVDPNEPCPTTIANSNSLRITFMTDKNVTCKAVFKEVYPQITVVMPSMASEDDVVEIFGNLTDATKSNLVVTFNDVPADVDDFTMTRSGMDKISTTVPKGATSGKIKVTTPHGTATSPMDFTVVPKGSDMGPTPDLMIPDMMMSPDMANPSNVAITSFTVMETTVNTYSGGDTRKAKVAWQTSNATGCDIGGVGVLANGTRDVAVYTQSNITLVCSGPGGPVQASLRVPDTTTFKILEVRFSPADPQLSTTYGIHFKVTNVVGPGATCTVDGMNVPNAGDGSFNLDLNAPSAAQTLMHTVACSSSGGTETLQVPVQITASANHIALQRWPAIVRIYPNELLQLNVATTYATTRSIDQGVGALSAGNATETRVVTPGSGQTVYTVTSGTSSAGTSSVPQVVTRY